MEPYNPIRSSSLSSYLDSAVVSRSRDDDDDFDGKQRSGYYPQLFDNETRTLSSEFQPVGCHMVKKNQQIYAPNYLKDCKLSNNERMDTSGYYRNLRTNSRDIKSKSHCHLLSFFQPIRIDVCDAKHKTELDLTETSASSVNSVPVEVPTGKVVRKEKSTSTVRKPRTKTHVSYFPPIEEEGVNNSTSPAWGIRNPRLKDCLGGIHADSVLSAGNHASRSNFVGKIKDGSRSTRRLHKSKSCDCLVPPKVQKLDDVFMRYKAIVQCEGEDGSIGW